MNVFVTVLVAILVVDVLVVAFLWWRRSRLRRLDQAAGSRREYPRLAAPRVAEMEKSPRDRTGTAAGDEDWDSEFI